ncbi:hypothetical protein A3E49_02000 [Candidatus Saccharibacteria bacterium RIFCSPHIGHO2_12_FULL_49_19]|nr:MAG: hypothetical protein A2708_00975 [Candidatus Saccharibacteria bacterium RIFCSPHIGHO2_01_FULL_49_21]OGL36506.1 MAG: hypothetical protein A3E49_02000 [Candidatus Saccharibacteria bacterium RIFCSPHIGHO2_12_FULL_49_19]
MWQTLHREKNTPSVRVSWLPRLRSLRDFADHIEVFPISGLGMVQFAEHSGYDQRTLNFLKLFSAKIVFNSESDFLYRCSLLKRLLAEESEQPHETLRSPQD